METTHTSRKNIITWAFVIAFIIVLNLFFHYAIALVYPEKKFEQFCPNANVVINDPVACTDAGGQWTNHQLTPKQTTDAIKNGDALGWCDPNATCNKNYLAAESIYNRNVFTVLIVLSLLVLTAGVFISVPVLSLGLSWGGVVSLVIASMQYWSDAENWMRVIILLVALGILVWLALKKLKE